VVRGAEEPRARRWTAGTPAAAINGRGSVRGRFGEGEEGEGLGGAGLMLGALKEKGRRRGGSESTPGRAAGAAMGGRWAAGG
jgi:hypothetical protein